MPCKWCGDSVPYPRRRYCCGSCENAAIRHAADVMHAVLNGEDPPDKPKHTHQDPKVTRWSPTAMRVRIQSLKQQSVNQ